MDNLTFDQVFNLLEPIAVDGDECSVSENRAYVHVGCLVLTTAEAEIVRDWLNKAIP